MIVQFGCFLYLGVIPVTTQRASLDTVRYAFAILIFINLCTRSILFLYFSFPLLWSILVPRIKEGARFLLRMLSLMLYGPVQSWSLLVLQVQIIISCISLLCSICGPEMLIYNQLLFPNISVSLLEGWFYYSNRLQPLSFLSFLSRQQHYFWFFFIKFYFIVRRPLRSVCM